MAKLSDLLVSLDMDSAQFRAEIRKAGGLLNSFGKDVRNVKKIVQGSLAFGIAKEAAGMLADLVTSGADAADQMGKLAQKTGVPVEQLSKLSYAAKLSDVSNEALAKSLGRMSKTMVDAAKGGKGSAAAFSSLGVSVKDASGKMRSQDDVLMDLADKFAGMKDGAAKAALAQEIFGKSGAQMIPMLNEGRAGLSELTAEAERLGLVVSADTAAAANEFNDNLDRLKMSGQGLAMQVAAQLTPVLRVLTEDLFGAVNGSNTLKAAALGISGVFKILVNIGQVVAGVFRLVGQRLGAGAAALMSVMSGDFAGAWEIAKTQAHDSLEIITGTAESIAKVWDDSARSMPKKVDSALVDPIVEAKPKIDKAGESALESIRKTIAGYREQTEALRAERESFTLPAIQVEQNKEQAKFAFSINEGELAKSLVKIKDASGKMRLALISAFQELQENKAQTEVFKTGEEAAKKMTDSLTDLREKSIDLSGASELVRTQYRMQHGDLRVLLEQMELAGRSTEGLRAAFLYEAQALDHATAAREKAINSLQRQEALANEAAGVIAGLRGRNESYAAELAKLNDMVDSGALSQEQYTQAIGRTEAEWERAGGEMTEFTQEISENMADAFADNFFDGFDQGLAGMAVSFAKTLQKMAVEAMAKSLLQNVLGIGAKGGWGTNLLNSLGAGLTGGAPTPGKALGGPVTGNKAYLVGEKGPELFVPSSSGSIVPHRQFGMPSLANQTPMQPTSAPSRVEHVVRFDKGDQRRTLRDWWENNLAGEMATR